MRDWAKHGFSVLQELLLFFETIPLTMSLTETGNVGRIRANEHGRAGGRPSRPGARPDGRRVPEGIRGRVSSAARRDKLQAATDYVRDGDTLVVTKPDRLARSTTDLLAIVERLASKGVGLVVLSMGRAPQPKAPSFCRFLGGAGRPFPAWRAPRALLGA